MAPRPTPPQPHAGAATDHPSSGRAESQVPGARYGAISPSEEWAAQRIAARVLDLLAEQLGEHLAQTVPTALVAARTAEAASRLSPGGLVDAAVVARELGVSRPFVYAHADELGAERVGAGTRPRLRFNLERARAAWTVRYASERPQVAEAPGRPDDRARRRRRRMGSGVELLPVGPRKGGSRGAQQ